MSAPPDGAWTLEQLLKAEQAGTRLKYVTFWGHRSRRDGDVGPHLLSQWHEHPFVGDDGLVYRSAEHFMMAAKARLFGDSEAEAKILAAHTAGEAKDLGRRVTRFDEATWREHRLQIVTEASKAKFGSCRRLRDYLVGTGFRVLVEASPVDRVWGIGVDARSPIVERPSQWPGENLLGFALMATRAELRIAPPPDTTCAGCSAACT